MTLTYNPRLAKVKVDPHAKIKVKRFKQESAHRQTDGHTHTHRRYQTYYFLFYSVDNQADCQLFREVYLHPSYTLL